MPDPVGSGEPSKDLQGGGNQSHAVIWSLWRRCDSGEKGARLQRWWGALGLSEAPWNGVDSDPTKAKGGIPRAGICHQEKEGVGSGGGHTRLFWC